MVLADQGAVGQVPDRPIAPHRGVQPVEGDRHLRAVGAHSPGDRDGEPHRGMHRDRERDPVGPPSGPFVELLHRKVETANLVTRRLQRRRRRRQVERLVTQFVCGDKEQAGHVRTVQDGRRKVDRTADGRCTPWEGHLREQRVARPPAGEYPIRSQPLARPPHRGTAIRRRRRYRAISTTRSPSTTEGMAKSKRSMSRHSSRSSGSAHASRSQTAGSLPVGCSLPRMSWVGTVAGEQGGDQVGARLVLVCGGDTVPARYNQRHFPSTGQRRSGG